MIKYFSKLPEELKNIISHAALVSCQTGMPAYLVGGFLRDLILGVKNFDLDIAVEGDGIIFAQALAKKLKSGIKIHERFGTATLILPGSLKVDIATTRKEKYPACACLPVVSFGPLKDDLIRRDFTINAMAMGIAGADGGQFIDPFRGKADLSAGIIRILHDLSFKDDPTRILRAIRFQQRFNFKIEAHTLFLLKSAIKLKLLDKVSQHRLRDELILMLKESNPLKQIIQLDNLCTLSIISKKLKLAKSTQDLFYQIGKEVAWFREKFPTYRRLDNWLIYFTALLEPLTLGEIKKITLKLGLRKGEAKRIIGYCGEKNKLIKFLSKNDVLPAQIFSILGPLSYETVILLRSSSQNKYLRKYIADFLEIYNGIRLYVRGNDLLKLGVLPGPRYQKIFAEVLEAKLNGKVNNLREELDLIRKLIK